MIMVAATKDLQTTNPMISTSTVHTSTAKSPSPIRVGSGLAFTKRSQEAVEENNMKQMVHGASARDTRQPRECTVNV